MRASILLLVPVLCGLAQPARAADRLVAVGSDRKLYSIDPANGLKTQIGVVSVNAGTTAGLARNDVTGTIYVTSTGNKAVYTLDIDTGTATLIGSYGIPGINMHGLEWDKSTGTLYGAADGNLYVIDATTGLATPVGLSGLSSFTNLGYDSDNDVLYATNATTDSLYTVHRATGTMTLVGPLLGPIEPQSLAYDFVQQVMYVHDNTGAKLYRVNLSTGATTLVGNTGQDSVLGLVFVPDPTGATSFCAGNGSGTACPCGNAGSAGNGCANSLNPSGANLAASGVPSFTADTLLLAGSGMPNSSALYFQGTAQVNGGSGAVFGDGLRCAGGGIIRLGATTNVAGTSQYPGAGAPSISAKGMTMPGDVRDYQCWYRNADPAFCTASTFNLTNGLELTWQP